MLFCYGNYFRSPPRTLPRYRSSCFVCSHRAGCRGPPPRRSGWLRRRLAAHQPLAGAAMREGPRRSRSRPPRGGSFESLQRAALRARTATPASRLLETWLRRCPVVRRVRSGLVLRLCPVRHRNHFLRRYLRASWIAQRRMRLRSRHIQPGRRSAPAFLQLRVFVKSSEASKP